MNETVRAGIIKHRGKSAQFWLHWQDIGIPLPKEWPKDARVDDILSHPAFKYTSICAFDLHVITSTHANCTRSTTQEVTKAFSCLENLPHLCMAIRQAPTTNDVFAALRESHLQKNIKHIKCFLCDSGRLTWYVTRANWRGVITFYHSYNIYPKDVFGCQLGRRGGKALVLDWLRKPSVRR